jgi:tetratricopeptide (TPR) repeat protein
MTRGEAYAAQGEYLRYLARRPGDPAAHAGLARAMVVTGDAAGARENYRTACEILLDRKRRGECEALYQEAVRGLGDFALDAEHQLGLAFGLERDLKPKLALSAYEAFAGNYPDHVESTLVLLRAAGLYATAFSDVRAADALYRRVAEDYPDDVWADFAENWFSTGTDLDGSTRESARRWLARWTEACFSVVRSFVLLGYPPRQTVPDRIRPVSTRAE